MKEGEIYLHKSKSGKKWMFRVEKIFQEPTVLMTIVGHNEMVSDTKKVWDDLKMEKVFP